MLSLSIISKIKLTDDDALNSSSTGQTVVSTCMEDPNSVIETSFEEYISGRKSSLNENQSIVIQPTDFTARFVMIETRQLCDIELRQPSYIANDGSTIAENTVILTGISRIFMQFGIYDRITITSKLNNNDIKWLILGQKSLVL